MSGAAIGYNVFGVFDGHGGKQAANYASKHVLPVLQEELADGLPVQDLILPEDLEGYSKLTEEDKLAWQAQDALMQRLPAALVTTFRKVQEQFHEHTQVLMGTLHHLRCAFAQYYLAIRCQAEQLFIGFSIQAVPHFPFGKRLLFMWLYASTYSGCSTACLSRAK